VQPTSTKTTQAVTLFEEKTKQQLQNPSTSFGHESTPLACIHGLNDNSSNQLKTTKYEHPLGGVPSEVHTSQAETNHIAQGEAHGHMQKTKLFDNFHMNYFETPLAEAGADHPLAEGHKYTNYMFTPREFDPFHEMMPSMQGRHFQMDGIHQNPSAFLYPKTFNFSNGHEDKTMKVEHMTNYEDNAENPHCPMPNFMDSENLFRQALRKASFFSYGGNSTGYRKDSMDLF